MTEEQISKLQVSDEMRKTIVQLNMMGYLRSVQYFTHNGDAEIAKLNARLLATLGFYSDPELREK